MSKDNLSNQTAGRKRKGKNIFNVVYGQPANNITGDEIDAPEPSISPKRNRQENRLSKLAIEARERKRRIKEIIAYINGSSDQYSNSADPFPRAVDKLSDPTFECTLPFPFIACEAPVRIKVGKRGWQYERREKFKDLLQALKKVRESDSYNTVWLCGTQGYGKSHLLAALVCYLIAQDERVIYIPDCQALLQSPARYVQGVMLFTWADDITTQKKIMTLDTEEKIQNFFESQRNIIIFIDRKDALNGPTKQAKRVKSWLTCLASGHKKVFSSSPNYTDYHEEIHKEDLSEVVDVYGGLERVSHCKIVS